MEKSLLLIKPGFVNEQVYYSVLNEIRNFKDLTVYEVKLVKYDEASSQKHYENKALTPFYKELTDYLSSGVALGIVLMGDNAIYRVNGLKHRLRDELPKKYNLKTDVMRNVLHASDSKEASELEIEVFETLPKIKESFVLLDKENKQISPLFLNKKEALKNLKNFDEACYVALYNPMLKKFTQKEMVGEGQCEAS